LQTTKYGIKPTLKVAKTVHVESKSWTNTHQQKYGNERKSNDLKEMNQNQNSQACRNEKAEPKTQLRKQVTKQLWNVVTIVSEYI
jgi:hypothetical protein